MAEEPRNVGKHYAYATLITRSSYLAGVVILAYTLKKYGAGYTLIVLYTPSLSPHAVRALQLEEARGNIKLRRCELLLPPGDAKISLIAERFEDTWTKLRVFELLEYDAICYLDADVAVFRNADSIFKKLSELPPGWLGASHACVCNRDADPWAPDDWRKENCAHTSLEHPKSLTEPAQPASGSPRTYHLLNGGMLLFRPSREQWDAMMHFFETTPLLSTFKFPDQDFMAHFFKGKWRALGWCYNALKTMRYWHDNMWRDNEVVCLHYIVDKPWAKRVGEDGVAGYKGRDGVTHCWWWDMYESWEQERLPENSNGVEVISLVRRGVAPPLELTDGWAKDDVDPGLAAIGAAVQGFANNKLSQETKVM